jgi:hypothetical protein
MSPRERRMLMILGGVAVVAGVFFLFLRGGDEPAEEPTAPAPTIGAPTVEPGPTVGPPKLPPLAIFGGRDPFFPLVVEPGTQTDGDGQPPSPPPNGSPTPPVSPAPPPDGDGDGGTTIGGHRVRVLDVFVRDGEELVQVEVDGEVFTVGEGDRFADNFQVLSIDGQCATFLFGDEQFTLCEPGVKK